MGVLGRRGGPEVPHPKLGLDLQGGLSMTLTAYLTDSDDQPDAETMEQARQIIEGRVNSTGVSEPEVYVEGNENIVVNVAGNDTDEDALRDVGAPAELRFRIVTASTQDFFGFQEEVSEESAEPSEEATDGATDESSQEATDGGSEEPTDEATGDNTGGAQVDTENEQDDQEQTPQGDASIEDILAKVGEEAATLAQSLTTVPTDDASIAALEPFSELTPEEVGLLPASVQYYVPTITCEQLDARPPGAVQDPDAEVTACEPAATEDGQLASSRSSTCSSPPRSWARTSPRPTSAPTSRASTTSSSTSSSPPPAPSAGAI
ncbi:hypothetical protein GCM10029992_53420 [Glycomyces albus]